MRRQIVQRARNYANDASASLGHSPRQDAHGAEIPAAVNQDTLSSDELARQLFRRLHVNTRHGGA